MCKAMERLPWKRFVYKVKPAIGNDLKKEAEENADEIFFKTIPCGRFLLQKFNLFKRTIQKTHYNWTARKGKHTDIF